jgi:hypothetical protein
MKKGKIFVFVLLLGILILTTDALALPVGQHFGFYDVVFPSHPEDTWSHYLNNYNFIPHLNDTEPNLIIEHAWMLISLNFKPLYNPAIHQFVFNASVELDGNNLGNIIYTSWHKYSVYDWHWWKSITNQTILTAIATRSPEIHINTLTGKFKSVNYSLLGGSGHVGPEPISMALVGAGLVGLPIAVRFRRLLRK